MRRIPPLLAVFRVKTRGLDLRSFSGAEERPLPWIRPDPLGGSQQMILPVKVNAGSEPFKLASKNKRFLQESLEGLLIGGHR